MPALRTKHRYARTCWALTVLAAAFVGLWIATGWLTWEYYSGKVNATLSGGNVSLAIGSNISVQIFGDAKVPSPPKFEHRQRWPWPLWNPAFARFVVGRDLLRFTCPLSLPALLLSVAAGWRWYRLARPFDRPDRPNRSRQFRRSRWTLTGLVPFLIALAIASEWFKASYHGSRLSMDIEHARFTAQGPSSPMPPTINQAFLRVENITPLFTPGSRQPFVLGGTWFRIGMSRNFYTDADVSLWFLATASACGAGFLWFIHRRPYPRGRCPTCQYSLVGLAASAPCPECGRGTDASVASPPRSGEGP